MLNQQQIPNSPHTLNRQVISSHAINVLRSPTHFSNVNHSSKDKENNLQPVRTFQRVNLATAIENKNTTQMLNLLKKLCEDVNVLSQNVMKVEATVHSNEQTLREMRTQLDNNSQILNEMKTHVNGLHSQVQRINGLVTPSFVPFKSQGDIDRYETATPEEIKQLNTYVMHFQGQTSLHDTVRYVLKDNILFTEELLAKINYKEQSGRKNITLIGKRLDHDLYGIFSSMFSNTTMSMYQNAVQAALKAAYNRTNSRTKRKNDSNTTQKRRKRGFVNESFYNTPYKASEDVQTGEDEPEDRLNTAIEDQQD